VSLQERVPATQEDRKRVRDRVAYHDNKRKKTVAPPVSLAIEDTNADGDPDAASSAAADQADLVELPGCLCELLGRSQLPKVRKHPTENLYSLLDVGAAMLDKDSNQAGQDLRRTLEKIPELADNLNDSLLKFSDGQRAHNVKLGSLSKVVEYIMLLPGKTAARVRGQAARLLVRYLGGDESLVPEVCALRRVQESLAETDPTDWRRAFGEAVETPREDALTRLARQDLGRQE
jgi:hypothetical protein